MTLLFATIELITVLIIASTFTDHYGSASFWPSGFYAFNRDPPNQQSSPPSPSSPSSSSSSSSPSSSSPSSPSLDPLAKLTGYKSVLDQATWVTSTGSVQSPSYLPPSPPAVRYNSQPPPPQSSQTTYLSNSGNSYPNNDWRTYNQYPTRGSFDTNQQSSGDPIIYPPFSGDMAIDCKYASIIRPIYSGSSSSGSTVTLPVPLIPPPHPHPPPQSSYNSSPQSSYNPPSYSAPSYSPPSSASYQPSYTNSVAASSSPSTTNYFTSYGGHYRFPANPCFNIIPPSSFVPADYSPYQGSSYLPSASNSVPLWSAPPPPPPPPPSVSSPIYSVMDSRPSSAMMEEPSRKSYQSGSPNPTILKSTRAVAELSGPSGVTGTVVFKQTGNKPVSIEGKIMGLASGPHGMHIYEMPFIGGDCVSSGDHYNPQKTEHGGKHDWNRHIGDLGNIFADSDGVANFEFTDLLISLTGGYSIINRTLGVSEKADDLGRGTDVQSKKDGNAGSPIACGIVHLSPILSN